jgi:hypothetical protein
VLREFVTAVEDAFDPDKDQGQRISLDGHELTVFKPTDGQYMIYIAETGRHATSEQQIAAAVNFFMGMFEEDDQAYLAGRLLDRNDSFGMKKIEEIVSAVVEDWSGRPTQQSSDSATRQKPGGRKSTRRTPALTSSDSPSIAS